MIRYCLALIILTSYRSYAQDSSKIARINSWVNEVNWITRRSPGQIEADLPTLKELKAMRPLYCFGPGKAKTLLKIFDLYNDSAIVHYYFHKGELIKTEIVSEPRGDTVSYYFHHGRALGFQNNETDSLLKSSKLFWKEWQNAKK